MRLEEQMKTFCSEAHYPLIDEVLRVIDTDSKTKLTTTRNSERAKIVISKFKYSKEYLNKDITVLCGNVKIREVSVLGDFAIVMLEGRKKIFNRLEHYKELIVFESEVYEC